MKKLLRLMALALLLVNISHAQTVDNPPLYPDTLIADSTNSEEIQLILSSLLSAKVVFCKWDIYEKEFVKTAEFFWQDDECTIEIYMESKPTKNKNFISCDYAQIDICYENGVFQYELVDEETYNYLFEKFSEKLNSTK